MPKNSTTKLFTNLVAFLSPLHLFFLYSQVLNDFSVALLTDVAAFAHTNPKSIGSKLQRAVTKTYGASAMLTNGGVDDDAATASDAAAANGGAGGGEGGEGGEPAEEVAKDETLTEKFDEDDSIAPRTW
jgi:hypothetical protein